MVSAARAHPTNATAGNPYLYAQVYTGMMFMLAAGCAWGLRGWKIGEMDSEREGVGKEKVERERGGVGLEQAMDGRRGGSGLVRRLFVVRRV